MTAKFIFIDGNNIPFEQIEIVSRATGKEVADIIRAIETVVYQPPKSDHLLFPSGIVFENDFKIKKESIDELARDVLIHGSLLETSPQQIRRKWNEKEFNMIARMRKRKAP